MESTFTLEDRNTLIKVVTNLENLEKSFDSLKDAIRDDTRDDRTIYKELEIRVRNLENFRWWILGMGVVGGTLVHFFLDKIK